MKQPRLDAETLVAHRGLQVRLPENSLPAIEAALAVGARAFEVDVQLSSDAVPMLYHDPDMQRISGLEGISGMEGISGLEGPKGIYGGSVEQVVRGICESNYGSEGKVERCIEKHSALEGSAIEDVEEAAKEAGHLIRVCYRYNFEHLFT